MGDLRGLIGRLRSMVMWRTGSDTGHGRRGKPRPSTSASSTTARMPDVSTVFDATRCSASIRCAIG
ncbi:hypothetical protein 2.8 [Burkholderia phage Bups phi1]|nr:hypothetical protein 2.8 [Burkholderia phage Bups phi1]